MAVSACFLSPALVVLPLLFNQLSLALNHFALALAKITAYCAVGCNYAVARDVGRKRVALQCLPHGLCTAAANAPRKLAVRDGCACRNIQQFHVYPPLERCDSGAFFQSFAYIHAQSLSFDPFMSSRQSIAKLCDEGSLCGKLMRECKNSANYAVRQL